MRKVINTQFTNQVLQLRKNNVSTAQIAIKLHASTDTVMRAVRALKREGLLPKIHPRDPRTADSHGKTLHTKQLDLLVFNLLSENPKLRNRELVELLAEPHRLGKKMTILTVERSRLRLVKEGLLNRRSATHEESLRIEKRVEQLRKQGLTRPEIASHLGISHNQVRYASQKLVHKGKLRPKTVLVHVYVAFIKQHMSNHPNQPVNAAEIARHLGISREWTRQLYQRVKTE